MENAINQRVTQYLKAKRITQKDFCEKSGYSQKSFSHVVSGRTKIPKVDLIAAFMRFDSSLSIRWLVLGEGQMWRKNRVDYILKDMYENEVITKEDIEAHRQKMNSRDSSKLLISSFDEYEEKKAPIIKINGVNIENMEREVKRNFVLFKSEYERMLKELQDKRKMLENDNKKALD